jgi:hypothetical protein
MSNQDATLHTDGFDGMANEVMPLLMAKSDVFAEWIHEFPGYIALRTDDGGLWAIGTANGTWGADLYIFKDDFDEGAAPDYSIDTDIPSDHHDPAAIADALYRGMTEVRA